MKFSSLLILLGLIASIHTKKNITKKEKKNGSKTATYLMPTFDRAYENLTVIIGNSATLPCFITNLGDHKVAWIKVSNMDILTIGDYKVTNDERIRLPQGYVSDWSLSISSINEDDSGEYICQVNTEPQIISKVYLNVQLPPKIIEEKSTINPPAIKEGEDLKLYCHAEGIPVPHVSWFFRKIRIKNERVFIKNPKTYDHVIHEGDTLVIRNISRHHGGIYECIANNSVLPAASRKIKVSVEFGPEVHTEKKIDQFLGMDARVECKIKSNPLINHYWMKGDHVIITGTDKSEKYDVSIFSHNDFVTTSILVVKNVTVDDLGKYECFAINGKTAAKSEVFLDELVLRRASSPRPIVSRILIYQDILTTSKSTHVKLHRKNSNSSKLDLKLSDEEYLNRIFNNKDNNLLSVSSRFSSKFDCLLVSLIICIILNYNFKQ